MTANEPPSDSEDWHPSWTVDGGSRVPKGTWGIEPPTDSLVTIAVDGRHEEPWPDVIPRLLALIDQLSAIPGVRARIDINVTVTMADHE